MKIRDFSEMKDQKNENEKFSKFNLNINLLREFEFGN